MRDGKNLNNDYYEKNYKTSRVVRDRLSVL